MKESVEMNMGAVALRRDDSMRNRTGFAIFLTGLSAAGKSTIAEAL